MDIALKLYSLIFIVALFTAGSAMAQSALPEIVDEVEKTETAPAAGGALPQLLAPEGTEGGGTTSVTSGALPVLESSDTDLTTSPAVVSEDPEPEEKPKAALGALPSFGSAATEQSKTDASGVLSENAHGVECADGQVCKVVATGQPFRLLPRDFASLRSAPDPNAEVIRSSAAAYQPHDIYAIDGLDFSDPAQPEGFYQIGRGGSPEGWIAAADAMEWRQALIMQFEHPGAGTDRRSPALLFRSYDDLKAVASSKERADRTKELSAAAETGAISGGVFAREPSTFADIADSLYVFPILEWLQDEDTAERARYLRIMASRPGARDVEVAEKSKTGVVTSSGGGPSDFSELDVDIVFALDMTGSMQPYIDAVREAVSNSADAFGDRFADARSIRFGLTGYRDNVLRTPSLDFVAKNYTETKLVDVETFAKLLENDGAPLAAGVSSDEWAEAALPGLETAIKETPWSSDSSLRFIILIGDASGHEPGGVAYPSGLDSAGIRRLADDRNVYISGVYIQNARAKADWERAQKQWSILTRNPGADESALGQVSAENAFFLEALLEEFAETSRKRAELILSEAGGASGATDQPLLDKAPLPDLTEAESEQVAEAANRLGGALSLGLVDYLGDETDPPIDFSAWILDNDLSQPNRRAVSVRVLITRSDLDNLVRRLRVLLEAMEGEDRISQGEFYASLRDLSARAGLDAEINEDNALGGDALLPKWIDALPYRSEILTLSPRGFQEMSASDRRSLRKRVEAKLQYFRAVLEDADGWRDLDESGDALSEVYALHLDALP